MDKRAIPHVNLMNNNHQPSSKKVEGILCNVGTDYVDVKLENQTVVTVLRNHIRKIKWPDRKCNPCCNEHSFKCGHSCNCGHSCGYSHHFSHGGNSHHGTSGHTVIPACHKRVSLRLAGLTNHLTYNLFKQIGCKVIIECSSD